MKSKKDTIKCHLIKCNFCLFEQQTFETDLVICNNQNCKQQIDIKKNLIKIVNGGEGGIKFVNGDGDD